MSNGVASGRGRIIAETLLYVTAGILAVVMLRALDDWPWFQTQQDRVMDWMISIHAGTDPLGYEGPPFVFIDIDERTHREWGEPHRVPRLPLADMIQQASAANAAAILVDIDLSGARTPADVPLERALEQVGNGPVHVLLARTFRLPLGAGKSNSLEERASFLDPLAASAPFVSFASTLFGREDDWMIRRYRSFEPTCTAGVPNVIPAMHLVAAAILLEPAEGQDRVTELLKGQLPVCDGSMRAAPPRASATFGDVEVTVPSDRMSRRILYGAMLSSPAGGFRAPDIRFRGAQVPLFTRVSAGALFGASRIDPAMLEGRIVMIGASHADSRDVHRTPVGDLPGAVVLMNATYSLMRFGGLRVPPGWLFLAAQVIVIAALSFLFARFSLYWAALLGPVIIAVLMVPLSLWLFRRGLWLDVAIPLVIVQSFTLLQKHSAQFRRMRDAARQANEKEAQ